MSWSDRRLFLASALALAGCGFAPVYGPRGRADALQGDVALAPPGNRQSFLFNRRIEERLGRAETGRYRLDVTLESRQQGLGSTSAGETTRFRIVGRAFYALVEQGTGNVLVEGRSNAFTGYSATGSTVATLAAERDAQERLMVILADQVVDALLLSDGYG